DPGPMITHDAPAYFAAGTTTVTWTASDRSGNTTTAQATITIICPEGMACTTIVLTPPPALTVEATTDRGALRTNADITAWLNAATATDTQGVPEITHDAPAEFGF